MKTFLIVYLFLFILSGCFAQKIKVVEVDNLPVIEPVPTSISMKDFNFIDEYSGK